VTAKQTIFDAQYIQLRGTEFWTIEIFLWAGFPSPTEQKLFSSLQLWLVRKLEINMEE